MNNITHTLYADDGTRTDLTTLEIKLLGILRHLRVTGTTMYGLLSPVDRFTV